MQQPLGFLEKGKETYVCLLQKSLYGLRQAGHLWYEHLLKALIKFGFVQCQVEHCMFYKHVSSDLLIIMAAVDDLTLVMSSTKLMQAMKQQFKTKFEMSDDGDIHWLLRIKIKCDHVACTISLSQRAYINSLLSHYNLEDAKAITVPMNPGLVLSISQCPTMADEIRQMQNIPFHKGIGSLLYAGLRTCPDITFATLALGKFVQNPGMVHWEALKQVMRYLKGTSKLELVLGGKQGGGLETYSDADLASQEHQHSISGYTIFMGKGTVSWSSKKQGIVALSTTD